VSFAVITLCVASQCVFVVVVVYFVTYSVQKLFDTPLYCASVTYFETLDYMHTFRGPYYLYLQGEDKGSKALQNIGIFPHHYMASQPKR
jgi:hypothetical protein